MARDITSAAFGSRHTTTRRLVLLFIASLFLSNAALLSQATFASTPAASSSSSATTESKVAQSTTAQAATQAPSTVPSSSSPVASEELDSNEFEGAAQFAQEDEQQPPAGAIPIDTAAGAVVANGFLATFSEYFDSFLFTFGMSSYRSPYASSYHGKQQQEAIPQTFLQKYGVYVLGGSVLVALAGLYAAFSARQRGGKGSGRRVRRIKRFGASGEEEEGEELTEGEDHLATQPLLVEVMSKKAKSQGSDWVEKNLKTDEDGDEAHEFLGPFPAPSPKSAAAAAAAASSSSSEVQQATAKTADAPAPKKGGKKK